MRNIPKWQKMLIWLFAFGFGLIIFFPVWYMLIMGFASNGDILSNNVSLIPSKISFENIFLVLSRTLILRYMLNTLFVALAILAIQILTCELAAYAFAFYEFKGKKLIFMLVLSTLMIPSEATIIANYLTISSLKWVDTYSALIIPFSTSATGIFLMRQYFLTIAKELREAAFLDGCGNMAFLIYVALPLSRPIAASFGITSFIGSWNMYMWPLLVTNKDAMRMVQVGITSLRDADAAQTIGLAMAGICIVTIPSIIVFAFGHRQVIDGMMAGSVKG